MRNRRAVAAASRTGQFRPGKRPAGACCRLLLPALLLVAAALAGTSSAWAGERKPLRVVGDDNYPPFLFRDAAGVAVGYVADWWALWSKRTGIPVEVEARRFAEARRTLERGEADVLDPIFRSPERARLYDFSAAYAEVPTGLFVHSSIRGIRDVNGLKGFVVGALEGDACVERLRAAGVEEIRTFQTNAAVVEHALRDEVRVFCLDEYPASYHLARNDGQRTFLKAFEIGRGELHRAVRKGDADTLRVLARGAAAITAAEEVALRDKWLPRPPIDYGPWLRALAVGFALIAVFAAALGFALRTARRRVRRQTAALEAEQARLASLFQALPDLVWMKDPEGTYVACNAALEQALGVLPGGLIGRHDGDFFGAAKAAEFLAQERAVMAADVPRRAEAWANLPGIGVPRLYQSTMQRVLDATGRALGTVAIARDITAQRGNETALAESQRHLEAEVAARTAELEAAYASLRALNDERQAVFDASAAGIVLLRERVVIRCNRTMETMLGYGPGELVGCSSRVWFPDDASFVEVGRNVEQALAGGEPYREEVELVRRNGSRFWARLHASPIDPGDLSKGVAGMIRDITLERAGIEEIKKARTLAEEAARAKSEFLANMSHEIRTPMNAIVGMAHLALRTELTPRQRDYLSKIHGASKHLLGIIDDILDFSKSEAGKLELEQAEFELEPMLSQVIALIGARIGAKDLKLVLDVAPDVPRALIGDELRIRQVLLNFCSNAVKFTEQGQVDIVVRLLERDANEALIEFAVRDTGIGLDEAQRGRLFQSFQQADSSTSRRYGGTGLGLAISKRLVELMHGEIGVDSAPGVGSTFWFRVRLGIGRGLISASQPESSSKGASVPAASVTTDGREPLTVARGARILLVEDNELNQEVARAMLEALGLVVDVADNGEQALAKVQAAAYDLVLMDMQMPVMDGLAATRAIRRLPCSGGVPIVAMTANVLAQDRERCLEAGMNDYLAKPIEPAKLTAALQRWLRPRRATA